MIDVVRTAKCRFVFLALTLESFQPLLFSQEISTLSKSKRRKSENDNGTLYICENR